MFGWGERDETTAEERASWKARAEQQRAEQQQDTDDQQDTDKTKHRRARRPQ